ncbi:helix-turn-helix transcriptional regulator [Streptomyces sp. CB01881]|uniref:helix-turn-helix domain-containing protein n=1 Tax=Streptomyces sp. CB01881 TaxID=2078691 RepID=UPI0023FA140E|nr:helix-turn-helix transcriptional regulator [Streptomyces sp. CB01881]
MPAGGKPTVRSRRLGAALRKHRLTAGLDQSHAADALVSSVAKISRMESGKVTSRPLDVRLLLDLYQVRDQEERGRLESLARESNRRGWWLDYKGVGENYAAYIELESDATHIATWQLGIIPGLLQTSAFAAEMHNANPTVVPAANRDEFIKVRQARQKRIEDGSVRFTAIMWEPAVVAPMGTREVHREQLRHLIRVARLPNVTLQILPLNSGNAARVAGPFTSMSFGSDPALEAVSFEGFTNVVVVESSEELTGYAYALETLRSAAWAPDASLEFVRQVLRELPCEEGKEEEE